MEAKTVLTRNNEPTKELQEVVERKFKGLKLSYLESYYLDFEVNEDTGMINKDKKVAARAKTNERAIIII